MKRLISLICCLVLLPAAVPAAAADTAVQIGTEEQLVAFRERVNNGERNLCATLTDDLYLSQPWEPIAPKLGAPYDGTFDGGGHTITGYLTSAPSSFGGLFGCADGVIQNLCVDLDMDLSDALNIGGVAGINFGTISNCCSAGRIRTQNAYSTGGIAGYNYGVIQNCFHTGALLAEGDHADYIGGIVGINTDAMPGRSPTKVANCFNAGSVTIKSNYPAAGGITGSNTGSLQNCLNEGAVVAAGNTPRAGGITGTLTWADGFVYVIISHCYNTGYVSPGKTPGTNGGILSYIDCEGYVADCLYDSRRCPGAWDAQWAWAPQTEADGDAAEYFVRRLNGQRENHRGEYLAWQLTEDGYASFTGGVRPAGGVSPETEDAPWVQNADVSWYVGGTDAYAIGTAQELAGLALLVNSGNTFADKTITLRRNIDLEDRLWQPIGFYKNSPFYGTFDGAGHQIFGLRVEMQNDDIETNGLFGVNCGVIENLTVSGNVLVRQDQPGDLLCAAGIAGYNAGTLRRCTNHADVNVEAPDSYAGGVTAYNASIIEDCTNTGSIRVRAVSGASYAGGIAALHMNYDGIGVFITGCSNTGTVTNAGTNLTDGISYACAGGIAAVCGAPISGCSNTGLTSSYAADALTGGITALRYADSLIENCTDTTQTQSAIQIRLKDGSPLIRWNHSGYVAHTAPTTLDGVMLVPLRAISELLGAEVGWEETTQTVTLTCSGKQVFLRIGDAAATVNGASYTLACAPELTETGVTMVPLRFLAETFDAQVDWDSKTDIVTVTFTQTA